jgi:hypothetical protein
VGIIFLGTPHRGSDSATFARMAATILRVIGGKPNKELLRSLEPGSDMQRDLLEKFPDIVRKHNYVIQCFYETLETGKFGMVS